MKAKKVEIRKFKKGLSVIERASVVYSEMAGNEKRSNLGRLFKMISKGANIADVVSAYFGGSEKVCSEVYDALGIKW